MFAQADGGDNLQHIVVHRLFGQDKIGGFARAAVGTQRNFFHIARAVRRGGVGNAQEFLPALEQALADFSGNAQIQRAGERREGELLLQLCRHPAERQKLRPLAGPAYHTTYESHAVIPNEERDLHFLTCAPDADVQVPRRPSASSGLLGMTAWVGGSSNPKRRRPWPAPS